MVNGGLRSAIFMRALSVVLAALVVLPLWTADAFPAAFALAGLALAVLVTLAVAVVAAHTTVEPRISARGRPSPGVAPRVLVAQFAAGARGSRAPPVASV